MSRRIRTFGINPFTGEDGFEEIEVRGNIAGNIFKVNIYSEDGDYLGSRNMTEGQLRRMGVPEIYLEDDDEEDEF